IGRFRGNGSNALWKNVKNKFSTYDQNHIPKANRNCAENGMGGWWYTEDCGLR
ncbi:hypothetical protein KR044_004325, partial [Drosophila immigrans]